MGKIARVLFEVVAKWALRAFARRVREVYGPLYEGGYHTYLGWRAYAVGRQVEFSLETDGTLVFKLIALRQPPYGRALEAYGVLGHKVVSAQVHLYAPTVEVLRQVRSEVVDLLAYGATMPLARAILDEMATITTADIREAHRQYAMRLIEDLNLTAPVVVRAEA